MAEVSGTFGNNPADRVLALRQPGHSPLRGRCSSRSATAETFTASPDSVSYKLGQGRPGRRVDATSTCKTFDSPRLDPADRRSASVRDEWTGTTVPFAGLRP